MIRQGVFLFLGLGNRGHGSEQIELVGRFVGWLLRLAAETDDALVLLVGEREYVDLASLRQGDFNAFAVGVHLRLARTEAHVDRELRHLEPLVQQTFAEVSRGLALCLLAIDPGCQCCRSGLARQDR